MVVQRSMQTSKSVWQSMMHGKRVQICRHSKNSATLCASLALLGWSGGGPSGSLGGPCTGSKVDALTLIHPTPLGR